MNSNALAALVGEEKMSTAQKCEICREYNAAAVDFRNQAANAQSDLAALLARHNALVEAVKWERECEGFDPFFHSSFTAPSWLSRHAESHRTKQAARAEVGRLIGEE